MVLRLDPLVAEVIVDSPDEDGMVANLTTLLPIVVTAEALISGQSTTSSSSLTSLARGHPPLVTKTGLRTDKVDYAAASSLKVPFRKYLDPVNLSTTGQEAITKRGCVRASMTLREVTEAGIAPVRLPLWRLDRGSTTCPVKVTNYAMAAASLLGAADVMS